MGVFRKMVSGRCADRRLIVRWLVSCWCEVYLQAPLFRGFLSLSPAARTKETLVGHFSGISSRIRMSACMLFLLWVSMDFLKGGCEDLWGIVRRTDSGKGL